MLLRVLSLAFWLCFRSHGLCGVL